MNRCRISKAFLADLKTGLQGKIKNKKTEQFLQKWQLTLKQGKLYHWGKEVVPYEDVEKKLKYEAEHNGMPLSRDGAFAYLQKKYIGFKKRKIGSWLKRVQQLQMIHKRPHKNTRTNQYAKEGSQNFFMSSKRLGRYNLGIDLFEVPKPQWSHYSYFFVAVLQRNGYCWLIPMKNKKAQTALTCLKEVFRDCKKRFGSEPTGITSDNGSEFKSVVDKFLASKGVERKIVRLCGWVEKKNSTMGRIFGVLRTIHGFKKSLELTLLKVNNIRSRITKKAPVDWTVEDWKKPARRYNRKLKYQPKVRKQPIFEVGQRVRTLQKQALGKQPFYKSYEGLRSNKHKMWSQTIFTITKRKKRGHSHVYLVNNSWRPTFELQPISGSLVILEGPPVQPSKPQVQKVHLHQVQRVKPPVRRNLSPPRRRSTRIRGLAPVRYF